MRESGVVTQIEFHEGNLENATHNDGSKWNLKENILIVGTDQAVSYRKFLRV